VATRRIKAELPAIRVVMMLRGMAHGEAPLSRAMAARIL
jgi:hypothetical protein